MNQLNTNKIVEERDEVTIRFCGDSGDGMQLTGTRFTHTSAIQGNDIATLPDYPAEIRAPAGSLAGVSGYQIHFSSKDIRTPGDAPDVLVAMNPAALKTNLKDLKEGGMVIVNADAFTEMNLKLAGYAANPLEDGSLSRYGVYELPITTLTFKSNGGSPLSKKEIERCKNFFALGLMYWLYEREMEVTIKWIQEKFGRADLADCDGALAAFEDVRLALGPDGRTRRLGHRKCPRPGPGPLQARHPDRFLPGTGQADGQARLPHRHVPGDQPHADQRVRLPRDRPPRRVPGAARLSRARPASGWSRVCAQNRRRRC